MSTPLIEAIASSITDAKVAFRRTNDARLAKHGLWPNPAAEPPVNDLAQAALTAITEAGYAVVPVEPETETLLTMAQHADFAGWPAAYRAMIDESSMISAAQGDG